MIKELKNIDVFEIAFGHNPKNNKKFFVVKDGDKDKKEKEAKEKSIKDAKEKYVEAHNAAIEAKKTLKDLDPEALDGLDKDKKEQAEKDAKEKTEKDEAIKEAKEKYEAAQKVVKDLSTQTDDEKEQAKKDAQVEVEKAEKALKDLDPEALKEDSGVKAFKDVITSIKDRFEKIEGSIEKIGEVLKDATLLQTPAKEKDKSEKDEKDESSRFFPYDKRKE